MAVQGNWYTLYGGYLHLGDYNNVVLIGSGFDKDERFGVDLTEAHRQGYGKGIKFSNDNNRQVKFDIDLVPVAISRFEDTPIYDSSYVVYGGNYDWYLQIFVSPDNKKSWNRVFNSKVFSHSDHYTFIYNESNQFGNKWQTTAEHSKYSSGFRAPEDTTHVKFVLSGERDAYPYEIIFPIEIIIPKPQVFRPMAIRKSNEFLSLNRDKGFLQVRKSNAWQDFNNKTDEANAPNKGQARIRKSNVWRGQTIIGKE